MLKAVNKYSLIFLLLIFTSGFYSYQGTIMPVGLNVYLLILIFLLIFMGSLFNVEKDRPSSLIYSRITLFSIIYFFTLWNKCLAAVCCSSCRHSFFWSNLFIFKRKFRNSNFFYPLTFDSFCISKFL